MLADDGRVDRQRWVAIALFLVLLLFPGAHLDRHAFNILYYSVLLPVLQNEEADVSIWWRNAFKFGFLVEIGVSMNELGQYIYR